MTKKTKKNQKSQSFYSQITKHPVITGVAVTTGVIAAGAAVAMANKSNRRKLSKGAGDLYEAVASRVTPMMHSEKEMPKKMAKRRTNTKKTRAIQ